MKIGEIWQLKDKEKKSTKNFLRKMRKSWKRRGKEPVPSLEEAYADEKTDSLVRITEIWGDDVVRFLYLNDIPDADIIVPREDFIRKYERVYE